MQKKVYKDSEAWIYLTLINLFFYIGRMAKILRIVLDALLPLNLSEVQLAKKLADIKNIDAADVNIEEMEKRVQTAKITLEGGDINIDEIMIALDSSGVSVKNIDRVSTGKRLISG